MYTRRLFAICLFMLSSLFYNSSCTWYIVCNRVLGLFNYYLINTASISPGTFLSYTVHAFCSLMLSLLSHPPVYIAPCRRGQSRLVQSYETPNIKLDDRIQKKVGLLVSIRIFMVSNNDTSDVSFTQEGLEGGGRQGLVVNTRDKRNVEANFRASRSQNVRHFVYLHDMLYI